jgi:site-specific DNA recombinase
MNEFDQSNNHGGRKTEAGSVGRVAAVEIERAVLFALDQLRERSPVKTESTSTPAIVRVVIAADHLLITIAGTEATDTPPEIRLPWSIKHRDALPTIEGNTTSEATHNEALVQAIVRAHAWVQSLRNGVYPSVEALAEGNNLHPKVVRQAFRLAFLSREVTSAILEGRQPAALSLVKVPTLLPLSWSDQLPLLG